MAAIAILAILACSRVDQVAQMTGLAVNQSEPDTLLEKLKPGLAIYKPEGDGPFPAVVAYHGCGRPHSREKDYAQMANERGVVFVAVDSLGPRGISYEMAVARVCKGRTLWGRERSGDVAVTYNYVRSLSDVDGDNMALMAFSHGGWAVMDFLSFDFETNGPSNLPASATADKSGVRGAFLMYPYCGFGARTAREGWTVKPKTQLLLVDDDQTVGTQPCLDASETLRAQGVDLTLHMFEGVTHAFDDYSLGDSAQVFDEAATARSDLIYQEFLDDLFGADAE